MEYHHLDLLAKKIEDFLKSKGYDFRGKLNFSLVYSCDVYMHDESNEPRKYFLGIIPLPKKKPDFIGTLTIRNSEQNLLFETYEQKNVSLAEKLLSEMAVTLDIRITLFLQRGNSGLESYKIVGTYGI